MVDGSEPDAIRTMLEVELSTRESADYRAARVFEGMGVYAPTLGIIGAVLGLMAVMQNLADPSKLGAGIAAAFTATVYGIGLANLFFLPIANKLKTTVQAQSHVREMVIEGMIVDRAGRESAQHRIQAARATCTDARNIHGTPPTQRTKSTRTTRRGPFPMATW